MRSVPGRSSLRGTGHLRRPDPEEGRIPAYSRTRTTPAPLPFRDVAEALREQLQRELGWAVLEPNAEPLWQQIRVEAEELLIARWRCGELLGARPEEAFFVRCGLGETMTEDDVLRGHLVVRVGLAVVRPAEFVVIEIELTVGSRRAGRLPAPERS